MKILLTILFIFLIIPNCFGRNNEVRNNLAYTIFSPPITGHVIVKNDDLYLGSTFFGQIYGEYKGKDLHSDTVLKDGTCYKLFIYKNKRIIDAEEVVCDPTYDMFHQITIFISGHRL